MSAKSKETPTTQTLQAEDEYGNLVYNMWIDGGVTINMAENSTVIFQTGRPKDPPPPGP